MVEGKLKKNKYQQMFRYVTLQFNNVAKKKCCQIFDHYTKLEFTVEKQIFEWNGSSACEHFFHFSPENSIEQKSCLQNNSWNYQFCCQKILADTAIEQNRYHGNENKWINFAIIYAEHGKSGKKNSATEFTDFGRITFAAQKSSFCFHPIFNFNQLD